MSKAIGDRLADSKSTQRQIEESRERYRPVAARGSLLYFTVAELCKVDGMYQYSLDYFQVCRSEYTLEKSTPIEGGTFRLVPEFVILREILFSCCSAGGMRNECYTLGLSQRTGSVLCVPSRQKAPTGILVIWANPGIIERRSTVRIYSFFLPTALWTLWMPGAEDCRLGCSCSKTEALRLSIAQCRGDSSSVTSCSSHLCCAPASFERRERWDSPGQFRPVLLSIIGQAFHVTRSRPRRLREKREPALLVRLSYGH